MAGARGPFATLRDDVRERYERKGNRIVSYREFDESCGYDCETTAIQTASIRYGNVYVESIHCPAHRIAWVSEDKQAGE